MKRWLLGIGIGLVFGLSVAFSHAPSTHAAIPRTIVSRMNGLSRNPVGYEFIDWNQKTLDYIDFLFNTEGIVQTKKNDQTLIQPVSWFATAPNVDAYFGETGNRTIAFPSYFGMNNAPNVDTSRGEGINVIAAVLSASLAGYDMTRYNPKGSTQEPRDFVKMMVNYYAVHNNEFVVLNNSHSNTGGSWWYELLPSALFVSLASLYVDKEDYDGAYLDDILYRMAEQWLGVVVAAGGRQATFTNRKSYSIRNGTFTSGGWSEPDAAAGMAYVLYTAYQRFQSDPDTKTKAEEFLTGARWCMDFLQRIDYNPFYEVLVYYAALVAAKMNAELGTNYSVTRMINWTLDGSSAVRGGWGMVNENWGGFHTQGLMGSLTDGGGYAFQMNTFDAALGFFPLVKYQPGYAHSIGKWALNVSNSAKYFYPDSLPNTNQTCREWATINQTGHFIGYEGLRKTNKKNSAASPAGWGDPLDYNWGPLTDFGYGNAHVGFFSGIRSTNVERILQIDLNLLDFHGDNANPTFLYYNPYEVPQIVSLSLSEGHRLYELTAEAFLEVERIDSSTASFLIPADSASVVVIVSDDATMSVDRGLLYANGRFVGKTTHGMTPLTIETVAVDRVWSYQIAYPEFMTPDKLTVSSGESILGEAAYLNAMGSIPLTIETSGSGLLDVTVVATKNDRIVDVKTLSMLFTNPSNPPLLHPPDHASLQSMFSSEYSRWNAGSNPDRGQADSYRASSSVTADGVMLKVTNDTWGVAGTSKVVLDFEKTAILRFRVVSVTNRWTVKVFIPGGDRWGYYLSGETDAIGWVTLDIKREALKRNAQFPGDGIEGCYIWFIPAGGSGAELTISDVSIWNLEDNLVVTVPIIDPEDPVDPEDPTDPVDPEDPSDPVDPSDPEDPTDPVNPEDPSDPIDPDQSNGFGFLEIWLPWIGGGLTLIGLLLLLIIKRKMPV